MRPSVKEERANPLKSNGFSLSTALSSSSSFPFLLPSSSMASHFSPKPSSLSVPPHSSYILFRRFQLWQSGLVAGLGFPVNFPNGRTFFRRSTGRLSDGCLNLLCKSSHPTTTLDSHFFFQCRGWEGGFAGRRVGSRWRETVRRGAFLARGGGSTDGGRRQWKKKKSWTGRFEGNRPVYRSDHRFNRPNSGLNTFRFKWPDWTGIVTGRRSDRSAVRPAGPVRFLKSWFFVAIGYGAVACSIICPLDDLLIF